MTNERPTPFRDDDLAARVDLLRAERDALRDRLTSLRADARAYRPWSHRRFLMGMIGPPLLIVVVGVSFSLVAMLFR